MTVSTAQPGPLIWKSHFTARPACRTRARPGLATAPRLLGSRPPAPLWAPARQRPATRRHGPDAGSAALGAGRRRRLWPGKELGGVASESLNSPAPSCTLQTRPQGFILLLWEGLAQPPPDATAELAGWGGAAAREVWTHLSKGCRGEAGCSAKTEMNSALSRCQHADSSGRGKIRERFHPGIPALTFMALLSLPL